jgi:hypothetical protein
VEGANVLKLLRKQLKGKYSICLSNDILEKFMATTVGSSKHGEASFSGIEKEIKSTVQEINKKKYFLNVKAAEERQRKHFSADRRKRHNMVNGSVMPYLRSRQNI